MGRSRLNQRRNLSEVSLERGDVNISLLQLIAMNLAIRCDCENIFPMLVSAVSNSKDVEPLSSEHLTEGGLISAFINSSQPVVDEPLFHQIPFVFLPPTQIAFELVLEWVSSLTEQFRLAHFLLRKTAATMESRFR